MPLTQKITPADFPVIMKRVEAAVRSMTWKPQDRSKVPAGIIKAFDGVSVPAPQDAASIDVALKARADEPVWIGVALVYRDESGGLHFEGGATCVTEGLIVRLPPNLAEIAAGLAERANAA